MSDHLYAIVSDIHANFPALKAVDADAREFARQLDMPLTFICLGDTVDYGPFPNECMVWVQENVPERYQLRGNHDDDASKDFWLLPRRVDEKYWPITLWTRLVLEPDHRVALRRDYETASGRNGLGEFYLFHSTPTQDGRDEYIVEAGGAHHHLGMIKNGYTAGLFGHTHIQMMFDEQRPETDTPFIVVYAQPETQFASDDRLIIHDCLDVEHPLKVATGSPRRAHQRVFHRDLPVNRWIRLPTRKLLLNAGSVGQPRRHSMQPVSDNRAAYLLLARRQDGICFQWRRVTYAVQETVTALAQLIWPESKSGDGADIFHESTGQSLAGRESLDYLKPEQVQGARQRLPEVIDKLIEQLEKG